MPDWMGMKGIYVLVVSVDEDTKVDVGALGTVDFEKGLYVYVGSAQNSLEKRVGRHLRRAKRRFWHIDYLLDDAAVRVVKVFYKEAERAEECVIARGLCERSVPVVGFGCSDCDCRSHLFLLEGSVYLRSSMAFLTANFTRAVHA